MYQILFIFNLDGDSFLDIPLNIRATLFLKEFKEIVTTERKLYIVDRQEKNKSLSELGFTKKLCRDEILSLSVEHYYRGPTSDRDRPGEVWEFDKKIDGNEIYIKLKIADTGNERFAKCISFHKADSPLSFPLKG